VHRPPQNQRCSGIRSRRLAGLVRVCGTQSGELRQLDLYRKPASPRPHLPPSGFRPLTRRPSEEVPRVEFPAEGEIKII
jgi:hypothetical protein